MAIATHTVKLGMLEIDLPVYLTIERQGDTYLLVRDRGGEREIPYRSTSLDAVIEWAYDA